MAVPTWSINDPMSLLYLYSQNHVLQHLVQGMAHMEATIGIRRAIVKDKGIVFGSIASLPVVKILGALAEALLLNFRIRTNTLTQSISRGQALGVFYNIRELRPRQP